MSREPGGSHHFQRNTGDVIGVHELLEAVKQHGNGDEVARDRLPTRALRGYCWSLRLAASGPLALAASLSDQQYPRALVGKTIARYFVPCCFTAFQVRARRCHVPGVALEMVTPPGSRDMPFGLTWPLRWG